MKWLQKELEIKSQRRFFVAVRFRVSAASRMSTPSNADVAAVCEMLSTRYENFCRFAPKRPITHTSRRRKLVLPVRKTVNRKFWQWCQRLGNFGGWTDAKGIVSWGTKVTLWGSGVKSQ